MSGRGSRLARRVDGEREVERARRCDRLLLELSMGDAVTNGNLDSLGEICTAACGALGVDRAGIWLFDETHTRIRSQVVFDSETQAFLPPIELRAEENRPYFAALERQRVIAADDVRSDPRTREIAAQHLLPFGISSLLGAPIRLRGRLLGTISLDHTGSPRTWEPEEERFAASLGDLVALALAADERTRAEGALRDSMALYRLLVDGARDLIFNLDEIGTLTSLNPALETLLGRRPTDWVGQHFAGLVLPEDLPTALDLFQRAISGERLPVFEIRLTTADGEPLWFEFTISVHGDGERIRAVFGVGREVTARKRAEERRRALGEVGRALLGCGDDVAQALAAVQQHVASAISCDELAIVLGDGESGALTIAARRGGGGLGVAAHEFAQRELVAQSIERGATIVARTSAAGKEDETGASAIVVSPLRAPDGVVGALVAVRAGDADFDAEQVELCEGVARELALVIARARRRREEQEETEVASALARVGEALITSVDEPVLLERLCRVTADVLGCDVSHTFLRSEEHDGFDQAAAHGDAPQLAEALRALPIPAQHARGLLELLASETVVVSRPGDGLLAEGLWQAYGTSSAIVIALRRGEELIGAQSASFRETRARFGPRHVRIAQGIAQLASLALANARLVSELEAASRLKSDFVATMSHELRTPLNVILGYNELLLGGEFGTLDAEQGDALQRMRASALGLLELIEATLDLSRLETGRVPLHLGEIDLAAWLREVWEETDSLRDRRQDLRFALRAPNDGSRAFSDAQKLKVIVKNLLSNAVKFTPAGEVEIDVAVGEVALEIAVRDTGIGMTQDVSAVIFDAFRQGDPSMTRVYGGVGLGLYVVSRLVEALCGRVEVESAPGMGSLFRVLVPTDARSPRKVVSEAAAERSTGLARRAPSRRGSASRPPASRVDSASTS